MIDITKITIIMGPNVLNIRFRMPKCQESFRNLMQILSENSKSFWIDVSFLIFGFYCSGQNSTRKFS